MLIAQAMGEYAGVSALGGAISTVITRVEALVGDFGIREYIVLAAIAVLVIVFNMRRPR